MPSDILTIVLSAFAPDARPPTVRPVSPTDESELVVLYLRSWDCPRNGVSGSIAR